MASKKTTPGPKTEDLTRSEIPGGTADWYLPDELTPRQMRSITTLQASLMPKFKKAIQAAGLPVGAVIEPFDMELSEEDTEKVLELQERAAVAFLKGWSLDRPLPETADDLLDLPQPLYGALVEHAARIQAEQVVDRFTVDAVEESTSPTGDSGD